MTDAWLEGVGEWIFLVARSVAGSQRLIQNAFAKERVPHEVGLALNEVVTDGPGVAVSGIIEVLETSDNRFLNHGISRCGWVDVNSWVLGWINTRTPLSWVENKTSGAHFEACLFCKTLAG